MSGGAVVDTGPPVRVPIDPRIRERRIAVRRVEGRRRLRVLIAALVACGLLGTSVAALHSPWLSASTVVVGGNHQTARSAILSATGLDRRPLMIDVDSGALAARLRRLPWVDDARVGRSWPSTVRISITERHAVAVVAAAGGGVDAVDGTGRVLAAGAQTFPGLPLVSGVAPAGPPGAAADPTAQPGLAVAEALGADLISRVAQIAVDADATITIHLAGEGPVIELGPIDQLADKLQALKTILTRVDLRGVKTVDVRVPQAPVLTRQ